MSQDDEIFWNPQQVFDKDAQGNFVGGRQYDASYWGGYKGDVAINPDQADAVANNRPYVRTGPSGQEADVARYQGLAAAAAQRQAYRPDFGRASVDTALWRQARNSQRSAAGLLEQSAMGNAPSRAEILGGMAADQSLGAAMAAQANTRGGVLAQAAARANAAQQTQAMGLQGIGAYTGMRGEELAKARGAFMGAVGDMRGQAYGQQGLQQQQVDAAARSENAQRALNQQAQLSYEQRAFDVNRAAMQAGLTREAIRAQRDAATARDKEAKKNETVQQVGAGAGAVGTFFSLLSDERSKEGVVPLADAGAAQLRVSDAGKAYYEMPETKVDGPSLSGPAPSYSKAKQAPLSEVAGKKEGKKERRMSLAEISRWADAELAKTRAQTEGLDNYQPAISDARAKREAFMDGMNFGQWTRDALEAGEQGPDVPDYVKNTRPAPPKPRRAEVLRPVSPSSGLERAFGGDGLVRPVYGREVDDEAKGLEMRPSGQPAMASRKATPAEEAPPAQMMDAIGSGVAYRYKPGVPGEDPNKPHYGTTTQQLKQTPMGASMVVPTPSGYDAISPREAVGPTMASLGNLNQRLRALEDLRNFQTNLSRGKR